MIRFGLVCNRDLSVQIDDTDFSYRAGDEINILTSTKWPETEARDIIRDGGMRVFKAWKDSTGRHGKRVSPA